MPSNFLLYFGLAALAILAIGAGAGWLFSWASHSAHPVLWSVVGSVATLLTVVVWYLVLIAKAGRTRPEGTTMQALWNISAVHALIAVGIAFALDALTTYFALTHKGFVELDPFTKLFIARMGLAAGLLVPRYAFLGLLYFLAHRALIVPATLLVFAVIFVGLAVWNLYQLHKGGAL